MTVHRTTDRAWLDSGVRATFEQSDRLALHITRPLLQSIKRTDNPTTASD